MSENADKMTSRKFLVWLVWLILTVLVLVGCVVTAIMQKGISDIVGELIEKELSSFFAISMMYLGVNVGQKAALAWCETKRRETEESEE